METVIPATDGWSLCIDDPNNSRDFLRIAILAWAISPNSTPVPITPFGRSDTYAVEYMVQRITDAGGQFLCLPNGPALPGNDYAGAKAWLRARTGGAA